MRKEILSILIILCFSQLFCATTSSKADLDSALVAYYPFTGNTTLDESGYGNNATNNGASPVADRYSVTDRAYSFNGTGNYMLIGDPVPSVLQIQNEISLSAWIYLTSYPGSTTLGLIIGSQYDSNLSGASIFIDGRENSDIGHTNPVGHLHFQIGNGSWHTSNTQTQVPLNQWVLITATRKTNEPAKIYYNNVLQPVQSDPWTAGTITYSSWMAMGKQKIHERYFKGNVDEARVYNRALTEIEVNQLYANYLPPANLTGRAEEGCNILSWDTGEYENLQKITVYRNSVFYDEITVDGAEDSVYIDKNVVPGITYSYSISSVDIYDNESIQTNPVNVTAIEITFTDIGAGLINVGSGDVAWGDYDNDGDLDLVVSGVTQGSYPYYPQSRIYRNNYGTFEDVSASILNLARTSADWGDYDNDGDLDLLLTGHELDLTIVSKIYRNDSGVFTDINAGLTGSNVGSAAWGDYDNDGDLDILLTGHNSIGISRIYRNDSGLFTDINAGLIGIYYSTAAWGDYDNDGDLDILISGDTGSGYITRIYRNDGGIFSDISAGLPGLRYSSLAWGDYDSDGDLDIVINGDTGSGYITRIYRNVGGMFADINAGLPGVRTGSVSWGDYDNDGDLDVLLTGDTGFGYISRIYRNEGSNIFSDTSTSLTGLAASSAEWGDYDSDGDLDIVLMGTTGSMISKIYRNNIITPNTIPNSPSALVFIEDNNGLHFSFDPANDAETPQNALTYNIDINIGDGTVKAASSDLSTGYKRVPSMGNIQQNTSYTLDIEAPAEMIPQQLFDMVWKVQAVDNCFAGSAFASKNDIVMNRNLITVPKATMIATDALLWEYVMPADSIASYTLQMSYDSLFTDYFETSFSAKKDSKTFYFGVDLQSLDIFDSLENNEKYYWRVKPEHVNATENPTGFKKVPDSFIYNPTSVAPNPPVSGFNPANDDITSSLPKLSWNASVDPDGHAEDLYYICQLDTINTFNTIQYADTTAAGITTIQVSSALPEGYRYYYRVKAIDSSALQSVWSESQTFLIVMPPQNLKIADDGANVNLTWNEVPINSKGVVYTVYSSNDPDAEFPSGWTVTAPQLTTNSWSEPHSDSKKFYRITVGSINK